MRQTRRRSCHHRRPGRSGHTSAMADSRPRAGSARAPTALDVAESTGHPERRCQEEKAAMRSRRVSRPCPSRLPRARPAPLPASMASTASRAMSSEKTRHATVRASRSRMRPATEGVDDARPTPSGSSSPAVGVGIRAARVCRRGADAVHSDLREARRRRRGRSCWCRRGERHGRCDHEGDGTADRRPRSGPPWWRPRTRGVQGETITQTWWRAT